LLRDGRLRIARVADSVTVEVGGIAHDVGTGVADVADRVPVFVVLIGVRERGQLSVASG
jgi:hypothetical protein